MTFIYNRTSFERGIANAGPGGPGDDMRKRRLRAIWARRNGSGGSSGGGGGGVETGTPERLRPKTNLPAPGTPGSAVFTPLPPPSQTRSAAAANLPPIVQTQPIRTAEDFDRWVKSQQGAAPPPRVAPRLPPQNPILFPYLPQPGDDPTRMRTW